MEVNITETTNTVIIKLEGELLLGSDVNSFQEAILNSIDQKKKNIIVDLGALRFISSWGIGMLIHGYTTAQNKGTGFKLASVPDTINETFRKIKIHNVFPQYKTIEEALNS